MRFSWAWEAIVYYVFTSVVYGLLNSQFWLFANHLFDPRQAKRLFGFIGAGALLGGILGGQIARIASGITGTSSVLLIASALLVGAAFLVKRASAVGMAEERETGSRAEALSKAKGGFQILKQSRLLASIAVVVMLTIMVGQIVDLQFNWAVEQSTTNWCKFASITD